jgi:superfamily II DNA or RNA helicase
LNARRIQCRNQDYGFEDADVISIRYGRRDQDTEDEAAEPVNRGVEKETLVKEITPSKLSFGAEDYLSSFEQKEIGESLKATMEKHGYKPYRYQLDAVKQALAIIECNDGVIIADVVGLGKTVIAAR